MNKYILGNQDIDTSIISLEMIWKGMRDQRFKEQIGMLLPDTFFELMNGRTINFYLPETEAGMFINACAQSLITSEPFLNYLKENTVRLTRDIRELAKSQINQVAELSFPDLTSLIKKIHYLQSECSVYGVAVAFSDVFGAITDRLVEIVDKRNNLKYPLHIYTSVLGQPAEKNLSTEAYEDIRLSTKSDGQLLAKYFWLDQGYVGRGLTRSQLEAIKATKSNQPSLVPEELKSELKLTPEESRLFAVSQAVIYTKTLRIDSRQFLYVVLNRLIDRVADELKVESALLECLTARELMDLISGQANLPSDLLERQNHAVIRPAGKSYEILLGEKANQFLKDHLEKENYDNLKIIKGQVACPGKVKGKVKLVFGSQHNIKVQTGDILVSVATSPQLLPAMKKAAAFVTDVGGIVSHAAIVARELGVPCIVGTKIATQVLKDGMMVEVDAENGIVRIIS